MLSYRLHNILEQIHVVLKLEKEYLLNKVENVENIFYSNTNLRIFYCFVILPMLSIVLLFAMTTLAILPFSIILGWI